MDASERDFVVSCQRGRLEDFDPLYLLHVDAVYRYLHRRTLSKEVSEDLTSTVFLKALESIRSFDPQKGVFRAWLYRIARNALIDFYRSHAQKTVSIENVWDVASEDVTSLSAERSIDAAKLHEAMKILTPDQREIVMLRVWEGLSYAEIAEITGKSEGNAKVIFSRAIAGLRAKLPSLLLLLLFPHSL